MHKQVTQKQSLINTIRSSNPSRAIKKKRKKIAQVVSESVALTRNRAQHVWDEDFHEGLVQNVVAAPHP